MLIVLGCAGDPPDTAAESADSGGPTPWVFDGEEAVLDAWAGQILPALLYSAPARATEGGCPALVEEGEGVWRADGDCTDADGRGWTGTAVWISDGTGTSWTYAHFGAWMGSAWYDMDGTLSIAYGPSTSTLTTSGLELRASAGIVQVGVGEPWPTVGRTVEIAYGSWTRTSDVSVTPAEYTVAGDAVYGGARTLVWDGAWTVASGCADEPWSGALTMEGDVTATVSFDGEAACDGCFAWSLPAGTTGQLCTNY